MGVMERRVVESCCGVIGAMAALRLATKNSTHQRPALTDTQSAP